MNIKTKASFFLSQVFKQEGAADCYLFVAAALYKLICCWSIWSGLDGEIRYIRSGSTGLRCAANPENKIDKRYDRNDWAFNKAGEDEAEDWEEGGVVVHCTVHDQTSAY